ncbi:hypothetical protein V6N13_066824 [Hibiscus sabdariffa]|uniref:Apoptosis inhibitor 5 n=1 Tax=Hibiscus sabdariffa TaxID=183260 RepID=A0ABR2DRL4_9ROSI
MFPGTQTETENLGKNRLRNRSEMTDASEEAKQIEKLYEFGERLNEAKDKFESVKDYEGIIDATKTSLKAKQLAAQLIPRFFKFFPNLSSRALNAHFDLIEEEDLAVRVQAIRGLPLFCKDTKEYISKIVDILGQLLTAEEFVERDAVHKALMSVLRQDVKESLTALFKHIWNVEDPGQDDTIRDKVLCFIRDKVFPLKAELLRPQEEMERHITDLIKKSLGDVTGAEFRMFMDFLKGLSVFGEKVPPERLKELIGIIEGQADLDAQFDVLDADHIDRLISCLFMAIPFFVESAGMCGLWSSKKCLSDCFSKWKCGRCSICCTPGCHFAVHVTCCSIIFLLLVFQLLYYENPMDAFGSCKRQSQAI